MLIRVGEITQGRDKINNSRSPLSEPVLNFELLLQILFQMSGRFIGELRYCTLVLPSVDSRIDVILGCVAFKRCRGDSQERSNFVYSRSPSMNRFLCIFSDHLKGVIFVHFK